MILRIGTQFAYENDPSIQLITNIYAHLNPIGIWSTRISTSTGTDGPLDDFIHEIEVGHPISGKMIIFNSEYAAKCLHELLKDFPWFVSIGIESPGVENRLNINVTDPTQVRKWSQQSKLLTLDHLGTNCLFYDRAGNRYTVLITKMDHPIPVGESHNGTTIICEMAKMKPYMWATIPEHPYPVELISYPWQENDGTWTINIRMIPGNPGTMVTIKAQMVVCIQQWNHEWFYRPKYQIGNDPNTFVFDDDGIFGRKENPRTKLEKPKHSLFANVKFPNIYD